ncbi:ATP-binding protein [Rhodoplanes azumiensis]|uniref:ATP-binding protein n=1 Tax=Rhodoplanes azumiensis TaxID=1897628 RepID=A0ABW5AL16_9BRAD
MRFGPFRLSPAELVLRENDQAVRIGHRALDILLALVERAGDLVTKQELIARAWPRIFVDEANLKVHVAALRKALRDGQADVRYIVNIPGRGYKFVAPVRIVEEPDSPRSEASVAAPPSNLPAPLGSVVGRSDQVEAIVRLLSDARLVTVVGPGGIGKTTVAVAAAERLLARFPDGVWFVDLAPVTDPALVPTALAALLGRPVRSTLPIPELITSIVDKAMLIVLDNCEHLVAAAAGFAEALVRDTASAVLATSREPLRAAGERVLRLPPLAVPDRSDGVTAAEALAYPAVRVFVERAIATRDTFTFTDVEAPLVAAICRRLDGIALAIEMAAGCVDSLGLADIARLLDDRFHLLTRGRRTALARHRTLEAALDWSYGLLPAPERLILRRLGVFAGWFTVTAAEAVLPADEIGPLCVAEAIASLASKSLVVVDVSGETARYRLLDTTRAYALEKLAEAGELTAAKRAHAAHCRDMFVTAARDWDLLPTATWRATWQPLADDLRAALDWACGPDGDVGLAVALTVAAVPLWLELSLMEECRVRTERALASLEQAGAAESPEAMRLYTALAWSQMYTSTRTRATSAIWARALALAEASGDVDHQLRALWGLWADSKNRGRFRDAAAIAGRFSALAKTTGQSSDVLVGERMIGDSLHFLGEQDAARQHIERMLATYRAPRHRSDLVRFQFDQVVTARMTLSRVLWLQGRPAQALRMATETVAAAEALDHPLSLCNLLAQAACPIALMIGDLDTARHWIALLIRLTTRDALHGWRTYATCFEGEALLQSGDLAGGIARLQAGVDTLRKATFVQYLTCFLGQLAVGLCRADRLDEARTVIDEALTRCEATDEAWCVAELLRIKGEIAGRDPADTSAADWFARSLDVARAQKALAWELRTATSIAAHARRRGTDTRIGVATLRSVLGRLPDDAASADVVAARAVSASLEVQPRDP